MIYAIGESRQSVVKVGTSADPLKRLQVLQTASPRPLQVLISLPGGLVEEQRVHRRLAARRVSGEWFDFSGGDAVAEIVAALGGEDAPAPIHADGDDALRDAVLEVFDAARLPSRELVRRLVDRGWDFTSQHHGSRRIARALGVSPKVLKIGGRPERGYALDEVRAACARVRARVRARL